MINLKKISGYVKIVCSDGSIIKGQAAEYIYPEENTNGKESIVILREGDRPIALYQDDIVSVESD